MTRPPAVAGTFYPADPRVLAETVDDLLGSAPPPTVEARAVIAPHAGYVYSGPTAAAAYRALDPGTRRVLVLGPTHRVGIEGMALTGADFQATPLGAIPTDAELTALIEELPDVITAPVVHAQEHSIEVQLPFLQRYLEDGFTVVPVAVGQASPASVAAVIDAAWRLPDTAVVISSDLSHYLPYDLAKQVDANTLAQIARREKPIRGEQACGAYPVSGMMRFARDRGLQAHLLDVRNSGDTAGDRDRVVGYAAVAWVPSEQPAADEVRSSARPAGGEPTSPDRPGGESLSSDRPVDDPGSSLPLLAYNAIARELGQPRVPVDEGSAGLGEPGATFVTLSLDGQLRGCIGSLVAHRPLAEDVEANALSAAFRDPRFPPLPADEFARVDLEVSQLTEPQPLWEPGDAPAEPEALALLRPHVDGVVLIYGNRRATFLPQVWDQLPDPHDFIENLKAKAGLPRGFWAPGVELQTYQVSEHHLERGDLS